MLKPVLFCKKPVIIDHTAFSQNQHAHPAQRCVWMFNLCLKFLNQGRPFMCLFDAKPGKGPIHPERWQQFVNQFVGSHPYWFHFLSGRGEPEAEIGSIATSLKVDVITSRTIAGVPTVKTIAPIFANGVFHVPGYAGNVSDAGSVIKTGRELWVRLKTVQMDHIVAWRDAMLAVEEAVAQAA